MPEYLEQAMACRVLDDSSDFSASEDQGDRSTETDDSTGGYDMDIIHIGNVFIPPSM